MQSTAAHFPRTLSLSMWGSFCGAVFGQLAQILSQQHSASSLSHAVDRGLPVLHTREFLRSCPWAVSSNSQPTVLGQYLVKCRQLRLACAPHEGDFLNSLEEDHLPIYNVVTFWQGEYTHNELFGKPCFGEFCGPVLGQSAQILSRQCSPTPLSHAVDRGSPLLHAPLGSASQGFAHILPRTASLIPLSCHMREINQTNHSLSSHFLILPQTKLHAPLLTFSLRNFSRKCVLLHSLSPHNQLSNGAIVTFPCTIQHAHHTPTLRKKIKLIKKNNLKKKIKN